MWTTIVQYWTKYNCPLKAIGVLCTLCKKGKVYKQYIYKTTNQSYLKDITSTPVQFSGMPLESRFLDFS